jgi:tripartite-type tricarboxylate transporter receptor subunit TctC
MDIFKHRINALIAVAVLAISVGSVAHAQTNYPVKPIRLIVPLAPGGGGDIVARQIAAGASEILGQPMVVDNKPGGSTIIGTSEAARAAPDGYTLLMATSSHVVNPGIRQLPFDAVKDFVGVSLVATTPALLVVPPNFPANNVQELIDLAKKQPGVLTFGSSGIASSPHLSGELFNLKAGTDIRHVPYKGMGPALTDLIGGHVTMVFSSAVSAMPLVQSGKLKAIATTGPKRSKPFGDMPAIAEALPGYQSQIFYVILAPAGTPPAILDKLNQAISKVATTPDFVEKIVQTGGEVIAGSPQEAIQFIADQVAEYKDLIKKANIQVQ